MDTPVHKHEESQELSLKELLDILRKSKWFIVVVTLAITAAAAITAVLLPKTYKASVLLAPVSSLPGGSALSPLGSLASRFGGLASLAGFSLSTDSKKAESIAFLESNALTRRYISTNDLRPILYANLWNPKTRTWKVSNPTHIPTLWRATRRFRRKIRTVTTDAKTGLVTLTISWHDPKVAATWANGLVKMTNDYLRAKAIEQADRDISYLTNEAEKTNVVELKQAIFSVLQNELNKSMLARGTEEYAFKVIDPAVPPEKPSSPLVLIWTAIAFVAAALLSVFLVLLRSAIR